MSWIQRFLGGESADGASTAETDTVRRITRELDRLDPGRARFLAAFAYILGRVAHADRDISDDEVSAMERIVIEHGGLPEQQAIIVVQMAKTQNLLFGGTENFLVTREFQRIADREQKLHLVDCLFAVSAADESIVSEESTEIRKISSELGLSHADYVEIKSRYRDRLEVLKPRVDRDGE